MFYSIYFFVLYSIIRTLGSDFHPCEVLFLNIEISDVSYFYLFLFISLLYVIIFAVLCSVTRDLSSDSPVKYRFFVKLRTIIHTVKLREHSASARCLVFLLFLWRYNTTRAPRAREQYLSTSTERLLYSSLGPSRLSGWLVFMPPSETRYYRLSARAAGTSGV